MESTNDVVATAQASTPSILAPTIAGVTLPSISCLPMYAKEIYPPTVPTIPTLHYAKPLPNISKIEVFNGNNFKRWQERVYSILDMHSVAWALIDDKTDANSEAWTQANKVYRHTYLVHWLMIFLMFIIPIRTQKLFGIQ